MEFCDFVKVFREGYFFAKWLDVNISKKDKQAIARLTVSQGVLEDKIRRNPKGKAYLRLRKVRAEQEEIDNKYRTIYAQRT
jgi:hypothetical protein